MFSEKASINRLCATLPAPNSRQSKLVNNMEHLAAAKEEFSGAGGDQNRVKRDNIGPK